MAFGGKRANIFVGAVIAVVAAAAIAVFAWMQLGGASDGSPEGARLVAVIHDGDGGTHAMPLDEDAEIVVETSLGSNTVAVADGAVFVREADCANHDCMHQGSISAPGLQIICLPHKLWIEVAAEGDAGAGRMDTEAVASEEDGLDAVAR